MLHHFAGDPEIFGGMFGFLLGGFSATR